MCVCMGVKFAWDYVQIYVFYLNFTLLGVCAEFYAYLIFKDQQNFFRRFCSLFFMKFSCRVDV